MTVDMNRYTDGSSGAVDWDAYHKAQLEAGEVCRECGTYITFSKGKPSLCVSCNMLHQDRGQVSHEKRVRCPHCAHMFAPDEGDNGVYDEGEHSLDCPNCGGDFDIETHVSYCFSSPALDEGLPQVQRRDG